MVVNIFPKFLMNSVTNMVLFTRGRLYLEELDETISEDELAKWSHDIDLFMEGLTNPDKLEAL